jgi:hypothetical protein
LGYGEPVNNMKIFNAKYIVAIIISTIIGASLLGYGYMDYSYKKQALEQQIRSSEKAMINEDTQRKILQEQLQRCLDDVTTRFKNGVEDYSKNRTIGVEEFKIIMELNQKQKDECFKKYK